MTLSREERSIVQAGERLKARERKARKRERPLYPKADRGRVRNSAYLAWLRRQPCAVAFNGTCDGPIEAAHIRTHKPGELPTGLQRKPDDCRATPLCHEHHRLQHCVNEMRFWSMYGLDPFEVAAEHFARFEAEGARG